MKPIDLITEAVILYHLLQHCGGKNIYLFKFLNPASYKTVPGTLKK